MYEGRNFSTKTEKREFTYMIYGNSLCPDHTNRKIPKSDFRKAYEMVPLKGPGVIRDVVQGSAYVWAILHDKRITQGEW